MRTEAEFIKAINCRFPDSDLALASSLVDEACSISSNAAFMVACELARQPQSTAAAVDIRLALLDRLDERMTHPLKEPVLKAVRRLVRRQPLPPDELQALMRRVAAYPDERCALAIVQVSRDGGRYAAQDHIHDATAEGRNLRNSWQEPAITSSTPVASHPRQDMGIAANSNDPHIDGRDDGAAAVVLLALSYVGVLVPNLWWTLSGLALMLLGALVTFAVLQRSGMDHTAPSSSTRLAVWMLRLFAPWILLGRAVVSWLSN